MQKNKNKIKGLSEFFACDDVSIPAGSGSVQIITDPDLGVSKTYGSYRCGSGTLVYYNVISENPLKNYNTGRCSCTCTCTLT
jgi:hypothetical protein